ncbi:protein artemis-like [Lutzomyia longipalpis]|uniref:protein artemis-like n=1 Tax=Lutzomyia longipalpis TaxID=7200 RepID=UPI0024845EA8|nr:protein artemis-like [Lutzomyia longipalpis]
MSTFPGPLVEFPGVSVDRFDGENRENSVFFLSHCHTDHMVGLHLGALPGPLYVSEISAVILRQRYPQLEDVRTLEIGVETEVQLKNGSVRVTAIPAGHCPGSVMFLFEAPTCRVLYTGDFRLREKDVRNIRVFERIRGKLDNLYVDSTFLCKSYEDFPSRSVSTKTIVDLIEEWTAKSEEHIVWLKTPAHYGSEFLFKEIHKRTRMPLHIEPWNMADYAYIPDMDGVFTVDEKQSQIHACWKPGCPVVRSSGKKVREILPTAMFWTNWKESRDFVKVTNFNIRVCYSSHSSMRELRDFITFLRPASVKLNVIQESKKTEMYNALRKILAQVDADKEKEVAEDPAAETPAAEEPEIISFKNIKFRDKQDVEFSMNSEEEPDEAPTFIPKRKKR